MIRKIAAVFLLSVLLATALWGSPAGAADRQTVIRLLYVNDFHGFAEPYRPFGSLKPEGGVAYLAHQVKLLRQERPSLFLAAGDMIQGDNWANLFQGASVIELMNAMKFDAMVVGNHEFDFGQEVLKKRIAEAHFPVLGANVTGFPPLKPYVLKNVGGIRIAIIGVITPETAETTHPRNVTGLTFLPAENTVRRFLPKLKPRVDLVLVLSHLGYPADRRLAESVPGIDVIVGGHSHTKLTQPVKVNETLIVQAFEHGRALGVLDLTLKDGHLTAYSGYLKEIEPIEGQADPEILKIVQKYAAKMEAELKAPVGEAAVELDGAQVRTRETNLGNLVADVVREKAGAEVAIINGGSIRTSISRGIITRKDIYKALPHRDYIVAFRLNGAGIRAALEHGISELPGAAGKFPQVSGLSFTYDIKAPPGRRVQKIFLDGRELDNHKEYIVATNDFLAAGGDGFRMFSEALKPGAAAEAGGLKQSQGLVYRDPGTPVSDAVIAFIQRKKVIAPGVEGRITALP
jgi:5'-nucleotidase/UDP-sugar diphosphatase